ncbi:MAG: 50S ribosomal protein L4 [Candidatus Helarchaeota archaeon]
MDTKVDVLGLDGKKIKDIPLPSVFQTTYRPDLIRRAVLASQANRKQPQGRDPFAGTRNTAVSRGSGHGMARVPRIRGGGTRRVSQGAFIPSTVGGRAAFPPKADKKISEKINKKERRLAIKSAIAATINMNLVRLRGHQFEDNVKLPLVVSDELEDISKTAEVLKVLRVLGVYPDIERASKKKIRPGKGKMRGRKYKRKKSLLIVISDLKKDILKGARNIQGIDIIFVDYLNAELLAPGGHPGRLVIWTESAFKQLK